MADGVAMRHVSLSLQGRPILKDISIDSAAGTTTVLLGRSGSGKTTLLRCINLMVKPSAGEVRVGGAEMCALDGATLREARRGIGYVIQETGLYPHMSIVRNVALPLELAGVAVETRKAKAMELLRLVGLDANVGERYPHQLSGGQRQRVGLARALVSDPKVLLLDEPFGALDPLTRAEMQMLLHDLLKRLGTTAVMVTHDLQEALYLADRIVLMESGEAVAQMSPDEMLTSQDERVVAYRNAAEGRR